ncbi:hypothetical protein ACLOJK_024159 [Asimina triloba]
MAAVAGSGQWAVAASSTGGAGEQARRWTRAAQVMETKVDDYGRNRRRDDIFEENDLGIEVMGVATERRDLSCVAAVISVGLRPRRIWNVLLIAVVMSGSDCINGGPTAALFADDEMELVVVGARRAVSSSFTGGLGWQRGVFTGGSEGSSGGSHGCRLFM